MTIQSACCAVIPMITVPEGVVQKILSFDPSIYEHRFVCKEWNGHFIQNGTNGIRDYVNEYNEQHSLHRRDSSLVDFGDSSSSIVDLGFDDPEVLLHYEMLKVRDLERNLEAKSEQCINLD